MKSKNTKPATKTETVKGGKTAAKVTSKTSKEKTAKQKTDKSTSKTDTYHIYTDKGSNCFILKNKTNGKYYAMIENYISIKDYLTFKANDKVAEFVTNDEFDKLVKEYPEESIIATGNTFKECFFNAVEKECFPIPFIPTNDIKTEN